MTINEFIEIIENDKLDENGICGLVFFKDIDTRNIKSIKIIKKDSLLETRFIPWASTVVIKFDNINSYDTIDLYEEKINLTWLNLNILKEYIFAESLSIKSAVILFTNFPDIFKILNYGFITSIDIEENSIDFSFPKNDSLTIFFGKEISYAAETKFTINLDSLKKELSKESNMLDGVKLYNTIAYEIDTLQKKLNKYQQLESKLNFSNDIKLLGEVTKE